MPTVRELGQNAATVATPAEAPAAQSATPAEGVSGDLVLQSIPTELDVFAGDFTPAMPADEVMEQIGTQYGAYVGYAHSANKNYAELQQLGIKEGDFYLAENGQITRQMPLLFWLVSAEVFATTMSIKGEITFATRDLNLCTGPGETPKIEEHIVGLLIVDTGEKLVPAKGDFRGVKAGALTNAIAGVKFAAKPEFALRSTAHKIAAQFTKPWGRVFTRATTSFRVSKSTGKPYHPATGVMKPADVDQLTRLQQALTDDGFMAAADLAKIAFADKVQELNELCGKK